MLHYASLLLYGFPVLYIVSKVIAYALWYVSTFRASHRFIATSTVPSVTVYNRVDSVIFWMLSQWTAPIVEALPFGWGHWMKYAKKDASWYYRGTLHQEELKSDVLCVPIYSTIAVPQVKLCSALEYNLRPSNFHACAGGQLLTVADADVASQIVHRWKDFSKKVEFYRTLAVFGPNVVTVEGTDVGSTNVPFNKSYSMVSAKRCYTTQPVLDEHKLMARFSSGKDIERSQVRLLMRRIAGNDELAYDWYVKLMSV
ncbi:hypothetical protein VTL71DRAFT_12722 [Oculimacula yallundae]|uniref:Uncharacterized protein n=1 Tax=Oculimacula yallundae TaxID=86028 RepID=A0ABR4CP15_9HELO